MKIRAATILLLVFFYGNLCGQDLKIVSWNIKDFGKTRTDDDISIMSNILMDYDIVAIQEVVAKDPGGIEAVKRLKNELSRTGINWECLYSNPTISPSGYISERYAYLYKTSKVASTIEPFLISEVSTDVEREPYVAFFEFGSHTITIVNFHACTHKAHHPERIEIESISEWIIRKDYPNIVFLGDMNLKISDCAFDKIKTGLKNAFDGQRTSLKEECKNGVYLSKAEDNILYSFNDFEFVDSHVIDFIGELNCESVTWKRESLSDHLPISISLNNLN